MILRILAFVVGLVCTVTFVSGLRAEPTVTVAIRHSDPSLEAIVQRVRVEIASAGYHGVTVEEVPALSACVARTEGDGGHPDVIIAVRREGGGVSAEICARLRPRQLAAVTALGKVEHDADFAIVVTEALHGLLLAPNSAAGADPEPPDEATDTTGGRSLSAGVLSLALSPRAVLDVPTGRAWVGASADIHVPLSALWGFRGDLFASVRPISYDDEEIHLESHMLWARWGIIGTDVWGPFLLGWSAALGPFVNRVTAEALAPRVGGSDAALGAILHASVFGEFPSRGHIFVRPTVGISSLVPRLRYQMSSNVSPEHGELIFEGGFGIGIRLHP